MQRRVRVQDDELGDVLRAESVRVVDKRGVVTGDRGEGGVARLLTEPQPSLDREADAGDRHAQSGHAQSGHEPLGRSGRQWPVRDDFIGSHIVDDGAVAADGKARHSSLPRHGTQDARRPGRHEHDGDACRLRAGDRLACAGRDRAVIM